MLEYLHLKNVGPAPEMELDLAPRLNLITGDNGLGKSFLLDVAWWALTRKWPHDVNSNLTSGYRARPTDPRKPAIIDFRLKAKAKPVGYETKYVRRDEAWIGRAERPSIPGLVIYALSDGGFAVWDPARNYWKKRGKSDMQGRLPAFVFSANDVIDGMWREESYQKTVDCNGLLQDWSNWIRESGDKAKLMCDVLGRLLPRNEFLGAGPLLRLSIGDVRDIPSVRTKYSDAVPILLASAGVRRVVNLAYMLVWAWHEHVLAAKLLGEQPTSQVVMLLDEIECHLHPRWQRSILNSLLHIAKFLHANSTIQLIAVTHSPLILASAEPVFDEEVDTLFHFTLDNRRVRLEERPWAKQGDVTNWLVSEAFGLEQARSAEAESAIEAAEAYMRGEVSSLPPNLRTKDQIHQALKSLLPGHDDFWPRWLVDGKAMSLVLRTRRSGDGR